MDALAFQSLYLIEAARIAQRRGKSPATKTVARSLLVDARTAYSTLKNPALAAGAPLPTSVDFERRQGLRALEASNADQFDRLFTYQQLAAAQKAANIATAYALNGESRYMRAYSAAAEPRLRSEISRLEQLAKALR